MNERSSRPADFSPSSGLSLPSPVPASGEAGDIEKNQAAGSGLEMLEAERRRLAGLLQARVMEPLNLLLAQANAFETSLAADPNARRAVAVLAMLARQAIQQAHDLGDDLYPAILEALGLEAALEALASGAGRSYGLNFDLDLQRLEPRLPGRYELVLYRFAQETLDTLRRARAARVTVRLAEQDGQVCLELLASVNAAGGGSLGPVINQPGTGWIEALGGQLESGMPGTGPQNTQWETGVVRLAASLPRPFSQALTRRELEVLRLTAEGLSNKEIARRLFVAPRTVNYHLNHVYAKLGVNSRTEAVVAALRLGLIER